MTRYAKTIVALLGALATWGITAAEDEVYSQVELWGAVLAVVTAAGVYLTPNRPPRGRRARADISEQGSISVGEALVIGLCLLIVLVLLGVVGSR